MTIIRRLFYGFLGLHKFDQFHVYAAEEEDEEDIGLYMDDASSLNIGDGVELYWDYGQFFRWPNKYKLMVPEQQQQQPKFKAPLKYRKSA